MFTVRRLRNSNDSVRNYAAEAGRDLTGFHWGLNQPTAISDDPTEALAIAVTNLGERYVTPDRSAEDIARALCITGTPEVCIKAVEERIDAGVRDFNFGFLCPDAKGMFDQMGVFARRVMPHFRP